MSVSAWLRLLGCVTLVSDLAGAQQPCTAPLPTIAAPAVVVAGSSNLIATVKSNAGSRYAWAVTNAAVYFGNGSHQITYTAGASGPIDLQVVETTAAGCVSAPAAARVAVHPAPAWYAPEVRVVPIVLSTAGLNGSFFTSELTLTNRGGTTATLDLTYTAAFGGGGGTASYELGAGRQVVQPDAIAFLISIGVAMPPSGNRGGTLLVRFRGLSSPDAGSVTVRTTSALANGRAGLSYPGIAPAAALTGRSYLAGLRQDARDRTNLALVNAGIPGADGPIVLRVTILSADPAQPLETVLPDVELAAGGFAQLNEVLKSNGLALASGAATVERVSGSAPYIAYAVTNNAETSDGSFIPAVPEQAFAATSELVLPVAVETGGFRSELLLANLSTAAKTLKLTLSASAIQTPSSTSDVVLSLAPGEQRIVPSILGLFRAESADGVGAPGPTFAGPLFLTVEGGDARGLFAGARTTTSDGRFGLFYLAVSKGQAAVDEAWIYGLEQTSTDRTNLALVNMGDRDAGDAAYLIELFDGATGAKVSTLDGVTLSARSWTQLGSILATSAPGTSSAYARITRSAGLNSFLAYGVINDGAGPGERTGDGTFLGAAPVLGRALAKLTMRLPDYARAAYAADPGVTAAAGLTLTPQGAELPASTAHGFQVFAGSRRTQVNEEGTFAFGALPADALLGELRREDGLDRQTFPLAKLIATPGQPAEPIELAILWDGPHFMNVGDTPSIDLPPDPAFLGGTSRLSLGLEPALPTPQCAPNTFCTDRTLKCQRDPEHCCLDYDGTCADGRRYESCVLEYQQWVLSTCFFWTAVLCCHTESPYSFGLEGRGCYATHEGRICQSLDKGETGLLLSTRPIPSPPAKTPPEAAAVYCGQKLQLYLHNNTCANYSRVDVSGGAGGRILEPDVLQHFKPHGENAEESIQHLPDLSITYEAPQVNRDGRDVSSDVVTVTADGLERKFQVYVFCSNKQVATPVLSPVSGKYPAGSIYVTIRCATPGAAIHFTTDGTLPKETSPTIANGGGFPVDKTTTVKAQAFLIGQVPSDVAVGDYTILPDVVATPVLSPPGGTLIDAGGDTHPARIVVTCATPGAVIHYTKTDVTPGLADATVASGAAVTTSFNETGSGASTIVKARAFLPGLTSSFTATGVYVIKASPPVLSVPEGPYTGSISVTMTTATPSGHIRYTLDGSVPTVKSPEYGGPVLIAQTTTVKARTFASGEVESDVTTATYTVTNGTPTCMGGAFPVTFTVDRDPGGNAPQINLKDAELTVVITGTSVVIVGDQPQTVYGTGTIDLNRCYVAFAGGKGSFSGFNDLTCVYQNVTILQTGQISGEYVVGAGGQLPGKTATIYKFGGTRR